MLEAKFDGSAEEALLVAGVVALASVAVTFLVSEQGLDGIGKLEFAALAGGEGFDQGEDAWGGDVAADDGVLRGLGSGGGLLDQVADVEQARILGSGVQ